MEINNDRNEKTAGFINTIPLDDGEAATNPNTIAVSTYGRSMTLGIKADEKDANHFVNQTRIY
jgi:hypothetical protein